MSSYLLLKFVGLIGKITRGKNNLLTVYTVPVQVRFHVPSALLIVVNAFY